VDFSYRFERFRRRCPHNSKEAALEFEANMRRLVVQHGSVHAAIESTIAKQVPTFAEFVERWVREYVDVNNKPSEQRSKRRAVRVHLSPAFGPRRLDRICTPDIEQLKAKLSARGLAPKTINNTLTVLRKCLSTAVEWGIPTTMPSIKFLKAMLPVVRPLSDPEVASLLDATPAGPARCLVLLALRTGLRFSELSALSWTDVDLARHQLCVRQACVEGHLGTPKNGRTRYVPLTHDAVAALALLPRDATFVFHRTGAPIAYETACWMLVRACRDAAIRPVRWHTLRHTFASQLVSRGAPLKSVQDLLGHATISMTLRYAHLAQSALADAVALLEVPSAMASWRQPHPSEPLKHNPLELNATLDSALNQTTIPRIGGGASTGAP